MAKDETTAVTTVDNGATAAVESGNGVTDKAGELAGKAGELAGTAKSLITGNEQVLSAHSWVSETVAGWGVYLGENLPVWAQNDITAWSIMGLVAFVVLYVITWSFLIKRVGGGIWRAIENIGLKNKMGSLQPDPRQTVITGFDWDNDGTIDTGRVTEDARVLTQLEKSKRWWEFFKFWKKSGYEIWVYGVYASAIAAAESYRRHKDSEIFFTAMTDLHNFVNGYKERNGGKEPPVFKRPYKVNTDFEAYGAFCRAYPESVVNPAPAVPADEKKGGVFSMFRGQKPAKTAPAAENTTAETPVAPAETDAQPAKAEG